MPGCWNCSVRAGSTARTTARELGLELGRSWFIGDKEADVQCGRNAGVRPILVQTGYGKDADPAGAEYVAADLTAAVRHILAAL